MWPSALVPVPVPVLLFDPPFGAAGPPAVLARMWDRPRAAAKDTGPAWLLVGLLGTEDDETELLCE